MIHTVKMSQRIFILLTTIMLLGMMMFSLHEPLTRESFGWQVPVTIKTPTTFGAISGYRDNEKQKDASQTQQDIETLVSNYFNAKLSVDMDALAQYVSDVSHISGKQLEAEADYIEAYHIRKCLTLDGLYEGSYRVYVYYGVKIYNIDTEIPSLSALYIKQQKDGSLQIKQGTIDNKEQNVLDQLDQSDVVQDLIKQVQADLETVLKQDSSLKTFYDMINQDQQSDTE